MGGQADCYLADLSCIYTERDRQHDCGVKAAPQNRKTGIQQERLHGDMPARSRRGTAASPGGNLSLNLKLPRGTCCREQYPQFSQKNTDLKNCQYMDYMRESRKIAPYHVNAIAPQQVALQHVARQLRCLSRPA